MLKIINSVNFSLLRQTYSFTLSTVMISQKTQYIPKRFVNCLVNLCNRLGQRGAVSALTILNWENSEKNYIKQFIQKSILEATFT